MHPVFVIDTSVISHHIINRLDECLSFVAKKDFHVAEKYVDLSYHWMNNLGFLQNPPSIASVIWVKDSKPYWRTKFYPEYKHGRKPHSQQFMYGADRLQTLAKPLGFNQYEADDVCALVHHIWKKKENRSHLYLVTVDCDWCGFVDEEVIWMNTAHWLPRIRGVAEVKAWMKKYIEKDRRCPYILRADFKASDIWDYKVATGDRSDNLKAGCASYLIDLMNPHPDYTLWKYPEAVQAVEQRLSTYIAPRSDVHLLEAMMGRLGLVPPIPAFLEDLAVA